jgi:uncharacterized membrane protein YphA (DoxX/SURF4 family)
MKIVILIARLSLGLICVVFGLNGFLEFSQHGTYADRLSGTVYWCAFLSHYYWAVAAVQIISGVLLLVNRFVPLALVLLGPVIVNILLFHLFLSPAGIGLAIVATILWFIVFYGHRQYFAKIFVQRAAANQSIE